MSSTSFEGFFLPHASGNRFCVLHMPARDVRPRGAILHVHAFAEEMNKSRRAIALTSRRLAEEGWMVMLSDLFGCGDSAGDFGDATWEGWVDDVLFASRWLNETYAFVPVLWGLRVGCLLVSEAARRLAEQPNLILWQPVVSGNTFIRQFLRLKAAAEMLGDQEGRSDLKRLRRQLADGRAVEVAGYAISSRLAAALESTELEIPDHYAGHVLWCEVGEGEPGFLSPSAAVRIQRFRDRSVRIDSETVLGPPFWQTQDIAECPAIEAATLAFARRLAA